jgi:hypothetical protein
MAIADVVVLAIAPNSSLPNIANLLCVSKDARAYTHRRVI